MKTITIKYNNQAEPSLSKEVYIKRLPRSKYNDLIKLQQVILDEFVKCQGSVGSAIANDTVWSNVEALAAILPIVGSDTPGIDVSLLEDDLDQIARLFFTQSVSEDGLVDLSDGFKPSLLSELHMLDFSGFLGSAVRKIEEEKLATEKAISRKSRQAETQTSTSSPS